MPTASSIDRLSRTTTVDASRVDPPIPGHAELPERILQFGTGAFLRGFVDAIIDEANRQGHFAGRAVAVSSTGSERTQLFNEQDGLFTVCIQGIEDGEVIDRCRVVGSVSRALSAATHWSDVLGVARSPHLEYVISNTTEVGISLDPADRLDATPPLSFPAKLTALLHERAIAFDFRPDRGVIVLCCELIENNGDRLRDLVLSLAGQWALGTRFVDWVQDACAFCNTLVDRIVPGAPADPCILEKRLGFHDALAVHAEPYALWVIEGDEALRERLPSSVADDAIVVTPDITPFRERKVRILNGTHSIMVPIAFLSGHDTVRDSLEDELTGRFVREVMLEEIVPAMDIDPEAAERFAMQVLDRFANPFIDHDLLTIALQQTSKMNVRVLPSIHSYFARFGRLPSRLTLGFSAFLAMILRAGRADKAEFPPDQGADRVRTHWNASSGDMHDFVQRVASDPSIWDAPPARLHGFVDAVQTHVNAILEDGAIKTLCALYHSTNTRG